MGAPHGHALHYHGHSRVHALPAHTKIVALVLFALTVVALPQGAWWALLVDVLLALGVWVASRVPLVHYLRRMVVEVPFVVFALLLPLVATGERVAVGPLSVSRPGLVAAGTILLTATTSVMAALALASTTEAGDLVRGLERLRLPAVLVAILAFMVRYLEVVLDELHRMRVARESRGFRARSVRQWPVLAATVGALFIRSFERGERVHLAMRSRGYTGRMPLLTDTRATGSDWATALALPLAGLAVLLATLVTRA